MSGRTPELRHQPAEAAGAHPRDTLDRVADFSQDRGLRVMTKWVYSFGDGKADGRADMKNLLGGKGANLAEMTQSRPAGAAGLHHHHRGLHLLLRQQARPIPPSSTTQVDDGAGAGREARSARKFGDAANPLLVSVRSGARASMPGMMDTVLNLGLNDETVEGLAKQTRQRALRLRQLSPLHPDVRPTSCSASTTHHFEDVLERREGRPRRQARHRARPPTIWQAGRRPRTRTLVEKRTGQAVPAGRRRSSSGARSARCSARG